MLCWSSLLKVLFSFSLLYADSKKVAFSAARTTHMFGEHFHQILEFDHVFLNKGGHFNEENSTFICGVPGFYFVTFT